MYAPLMDSTDAIKLRTATPADIDTIADVWTAFMVDEPEDPVLLEHTWSTRDPERPDEDLVIEIGGRAIGHAILERAHWHEDPDRRCFILPALLPQHEHLAPRVYDALEGRAMDQGARVLQTAAPAAHPSRVDLVLGRGYVHERSYTGWRLDLEKHGRRLREWALESGRRMERQNIRLLTFDRHLAAGRMENLHDAYEEGRADAPRGNAYVRMTPEAFRAHIASPGLREDRIWIAVRDSEILGLSMLIYPPVRGHVWTDWTGIVRSARGQGVARALKLATLVQAMDLGITSVRTSNASENLPVIHLNRVFGYEEIPHFVHYSRAATAPG